MDEYRTQFEKAEPFPHVAIDGFLESGIAESLHTNFPPFIPERAINEFGAVGTNCYINDIWNIGPDFKRFYDYIVSSEFLRALSAITGIPDLIADPELRGGGTHNTREGHELDPHLDFNVQDDLHRRLNVLIYMNKGWRKKWGGSIELFENGRDTLNSPYRRYNCKFNRCVIFETSERSWHGFRRTRLPAGDEHRTRRLISLYYYTKTRPDWQEVVYRPTFFCPYFPERLSDPRPLTDEDRAGLVEAIQKRDRWLQFYQEREIVVRKAYGYTPPGNEYPGPLAPASASADPQSAPDAASLGLASASADPQSAPDAASLAHDLERVRFRWLVKQVARVFAIKSGWMLKRALGRG